MIHPKVLLFAVLVAFTTIVAAAEYEYEGNCTEALASGIKLATDCSIIWVSENGKKYCFANAKVKEQFLQSPNDNLAKADAFWKDPEFWRTLNKIREAEEKAKN